MMDKFSVLVRTFWGTVLFNSLVLLLGMVTYPESFSLLMDPLSWLGKWVTAAGHANTGLFFLTAITLVADAAIWRYAVSLAVLPWLQRWEIRVFGAMVPLGFLIMAFPCDVFVLTHSVGAGIMVGGLWAFTALNLFYLQKYGALEPLGHLVLQLVWGGGLLRRKLCPGLTPQGL